MLPVEYFKLQAKKLFKDYKTKSPFLDNVIGDYLYEYHPKYFDVDGIIIDFDIDEDDFSLMKAQHIIAFMVGFRKWEDLLKASPKELELAKLKFDNQDKISSEEWYMRIFAIEREHDIIFDSEFKLQLFKHDLQYNEEPGFLVHDYRLNANISHVIINEKPQQTLKPNPNIKITSLPLSKTDSAEFIEVANDVFETVIQRVDPNNPELTRKLWDVENYVSTLLTEDMLPISKDYALSLIDAFLVHHVIALSVEANKIIMQS